MRKAWKKKRIQTSDNEEDPPKESKPRGTLVNGQLAELMALAQDDDTQENKEAPSPGEFLLPMQTDKRPRARLPLVRVGVRAKVFKLMKALMGNKHVADVMERAMYDAAFDDRFSVFAYRTRWMTLKANLSKDFIEFLCTAPEGHVRLVGADFTAEDFAMLNNANALRALETEAQEIRDSGNIALQEKMVEAVEGEFVCSKCKSNKTTFFQLQTRRADEGITTFIQCVQCRRRWKQS